MPGPVIHERRFLSLYTIETLGVVVHVNGVPTDADADVTVTLVRTDVDPQVTVFSRTSDHGATGVYEVTLASSETDTPGTYEVRWAFLIGGNAQSIVGYVEIGEAAPAYDALDADHKLIVERVWSHFADAFDSPWGGPFLQVPFQSNMGRARMAELLQSSIDVVNFARQPITDFNLIPVGQPGSKLLPTKWHGVLVKVLEVEVIKHLMRSYVEQPSPVNVGVAYLDRRDYINRWQTMLDIATKELEPLIESLKVSMMFKGGRVLVAGGVFREVNSRMFDPARPRYWFGYY